MRSVVVGLVAAMLVAGLAPVSAFAKDKPAPAVPGQGDAKSHKEAMTDAPPLVQQLGLNCTPTDGNLVGISKQKNDKGVETDSKVYELVCEEGLGYVVMAAKDQTPQAFDCLTLTANVPAAGEKDTGKLYCRLTANLDPKAYIQSMATKAGLSCTIDQARMRGLDSTKKFHQFEASCAGDGVYLVQVPDKGSTEPFSTISCLNAETGVCSYMTQERKAAEFTKLAAPANRSACQINDSRYIGTSTSDKNSYYEIGCTDSKLGYVLQLNAANKFVAAIDCARASAIGTGCTLNTAVAAQTDEVNIYTRLAKEIGLACDVKAYHSLGLEQGTGREIVELACNNQPSSYVATLPVEKGQTGEYVNCARAAARGIKCSLSQPDSLYPALTTQIQAAGKSCKVNNFRGVGRSPEGSDFVEVTCTGEPGLMIEYGPGPDKVKTAMACVTARGIGGGCKMQ